MKTGTFDPQQVYLLGTLSEGACYLDALTHWATPGLRSDRVRLQHEPFRRDVHEAE
jgi:hypothetical protein